MALSFVAEYIDFAATNFDELVVLTIQHALLAADTIAIAVPIAVTLGVATTYDDRAATVILWLAGIAMTIPSLALFGLLIPFLGIGSPPVIFALVLYSQLPVIRNTYVGLTKIDEATLSAGRGLGMTRRQRLRRIQLPIAMPVILAGVRNAVVIVIGVAAVGAYVGADGLGEYIFEGIRTGNTTMIVVATIVVSLLALAVDYTFGVVEQYLRLRNGETIDQALGTRFLTTLLSVRNTHQ